MLRKQLALIDYFEMNTEHEYLEMGGLVQPGP